MKLKHLLPVFMPRACSAGSLYAQQVQQTPATQQQQTASDDLTPMW